MDGGPAHADSASPAARKGRAYGLCGQASAMDVMTSSLLTSLLHPPAQDPVRVLCHLLSLDASDHLALVGVSPFCPFVSSDHLTQLTPCSSPNCQA